MPKLLEILEVLEVPVEEFFYKNIQQYREDMEVQNILNILILQAKAWQYFQRQKAVCARQFQKTFLDILIMI